MISWQIAPNSGGYIEGLHGGILCMAGFQRMNHRHWRQAITCSLNHVDNFHEMFVRT